MDSLARVVISVKRVNILLEGLRAVIRLLPATIQRLERQLILPTVLDTIPVQDLLERCALLDIVVRRVLQLRLHHAQQAPTLL